MNSLFPSTYLRLIFFVFKLYFYFVIFFSQAAFIEEAPDDGENSTELMVISSKQNVLIEYVFNVLILLLQSARRTVLLYENRRTFKFTELCLWVHLSIAFCLFGLYSFESLSQLFYVRAVILITQIHFNDYLCSQRAFCAYCHDRIWGLGRQGFKCTQCKLLVHKKCHKLGSKSCTNEHVEPLKERDGLNGVGGDHHPQEIVPPAPDYPPEIPEQGM